MRNKVGYLVRLVAAAYGVIITGFVPSSAYPARPVVHSLPLSIGYFEDNGQLLCQDDAAVGEGPTRRSRSKSRRLVRAGRTHFFLARNIWKPRTGR